MRNKPLFKTIAIILFAFIAISLIIINPVRGGTDQIIVTDADSTLDILVNISPNLFDLVTSIDDRFVVQYANTMKGFLVQPLPPQLRDLVDLIEAKIIIQAANSNKTYLFNYPVSLINDNFSPQIHSVDVYNSGIGSAIISWVSDEYTSSTIHLGSQSGVYPTTIYDEQYSLNHEIPVSGLIPGTRYYFIIESLDRSENSSTSEEFNFTPSSLIYMPIIQR